MHYQFTFQTKLERGDVFLMHIVDGALTMYLNVREHLRQIILSNKTQDEKLATVNSAFVARAFVELYIGETPVSPNIFTDIKAGLTAFLAAEKKH